MKYRVYEDNHSVVEIKERNPNFRLVVDQSHVPYPLQIATRRSLHVRLVIHDIVQMLSDNVQHLVVIIQCIIRRDELNHRFSFEENHRYCIPFLKQYQRRFR